MVLQALQKVFSKLSYVILALAVSTVAFAIAVWFPNIPLIVSVLGQPNVTLLQKLELPISLLGSITTNFTLLSASYTIAIAVLFGMYVALMMYFLKRRIQKAGQAGIATGFLGVMSGVLGVGCAACGSFLLVSVLTLVGAGGALAFLPFGGSEFGIAGVILLLVSIYIIAKQIQNPEVCKIND